jgi:hypothetical protein
MEVSAPPAGAGLREMVTGENSEGHCFGFAASLVPKKEHLPSQSWQML